MQSGAGQRAHVRWPVQLDAELTGEGGAATAQIQNLSLGGAFLVCTTAMQVGAGLRLSFRLPNGMPVSATGRVVRVQTQAPKGVAVEFYGLDDVTREILNSSFAAESAAAAAADRDATFEQKFRIETDRKERVYLLLCGFLDRKECENLVRTMNDVLGGLSGSGVRLCINATQYQCCTPDSVEHFKRSFAQLAKREWLAAALVGPKSVGMMQLRRAARDASVADSFASFETVSEALEFLEMVQA